MTVQSKDPTTLPRILVSSEDYGRLESLLDTYGGDRDSELVDHLATELSRSEVVPPEQLPQDVVRMHSVVTFVDVDGGGTREYQLVYPHEADAASRRLSVLAPIGCALLGLSVGQEIVWPLPDGRKRKLRVTAVSNPG